MVVKSAKDKDGCQYHGYTGNNYYPASIIIGGRTISSLTECIDAYTTIEAAYNEKDAHLAGMGAMPDIDWGQPDVINFIERLEISTDGITITANKEETTTITADGTTITVVTPLEEVLPTEMQKLIILYYELTNLKQQMHAICYRALDILKSEENELDIKEYGKWIKRFNTVETDYLLAETCMEFGDFAEARAVMDEIPLKYAELDWVAHRNFEEYLKVVHEVSRVEEEGNIPVSCEGTLAHLSFSDDFVAGKAYALGEMIFEDWTDRYTLGFTIPASCACDEYFYGIAKNDNSSETQTKEGKSQEQPSQEQQYTDTPLSITEEAKAEITIKPNPTTGQLKIESGQLKMESIEIFDVYGRKLAMYNQHQSTYQIDVSHLANGLYFMKIVTEDGSQQMKKFVKQ
jgi:hypothetical protein